MVDSKRQATFAGKQAHLLLLSCISHLLISAIATWSSNSVVALKFLGTSILLDACHLVQQTLLNAWLNHMENSRWLIAFANAIFCVSWVLCYSCSVGVTVFLNSMVWTRMKLPLHVTRAKKLSKQVICAFCSKKGRPTPVKNSIIVFGIPSNRKDIRTHWCFVHLKKQKFDNPLPFFWLIIMRMRKRN